MPYKNALIVVLIGPNALVFKRANSAIAAENVYPFFATNQDHKK